MIEKAYEVCNFGASSMAIYKVQYLRQDPKDENAQIIWEELWLSDSFEHILDKFKREREDLYIEMKSINKYDNVLGYLKTKEASE